MNRKEEMSDWSDEKLAGWARAWHWNDCAADIPVDPSIYYRDMRLLKAFAAALRASAAPEEGMSEDAREELWEIFYGAFWKSMGEYSGKEPTTAGRAGFNAVMSALPSDSGKAAPVAWRAISKNRFAHGLLTADPEIAALWRETEGITVEPLVTMALPSADRKGEANV